jgi:hypothetical protein
MSDRRAYDPFAPHDETPATRQIGRHATPDPVAVPVELPTGLDRLTRAELEALATQHGVSTEGTRVEILQRLRELRQ